MFLYFPCIPWPTPRAGGGEGCRYHPGSTCTHRHLCGLQVNKGRHGNPLDTYVLTVSCSGLLRNTISSRLWSDRWNLCETRCLPKSPNEAVVYFSPLSTGWMTLGNAKQVNAHTQSACLIIMLIMKHVVWICIQHFCGNLWGTQGGLWTEVKLTEAILKLLVERNSPPFCPEFQSPQETPNYHPTPSQGIPPESLHSIPLG